MPEINITQLRRIIFRKKTTAGGAWSVFTMEPDDLGQDTSMSVNIAPRKKSRASALGTTNTPIKGTFDNLAASVTFMNDTYKLLGQAIGKWNAATYANADANAGNIILGDGTDLCADQGYYSVVAQGICDDGSTVDLEITRCQPSVDDDIELGTSDTQTITLNLNPIIYNSARHGSDGYPAYTVRFGENNLTKKQRLSTLTGDYADVTS